MPAPNPTRPPHAIGRLSAPALRLAALLVLAGAVAVAPPASAAGEEASPTKAPPTPANDTLAGAQAIRSLPASLSGTLVGATVEGAEPSGACGAATGPSVWYSLRVAKRQRIALDLAASGALDATVDVYHAVRSQLSSVGCQRTEGEGKASFSFQAAKNGLYDIRVAAVQNSQLAPFALEVFLPTPAIRPPGRPLPPAGATGQVDRVQNINAAYSVTMHAGVSYLIDLASESKGGCVSAALFRPGNTSFGAEEEEAPSGGVLHIQCGGFRLYTPGAGEGGLYSFDITPRFSHRGVQRFHLQVSVAGPAETAPGILLGNYATASAHLDARTTDVLRLYRMEVTSHSKLTLKLTAPESADFNLQLRNKDGDLVECQCGGSGSQNLQHQLLPGTYYAVVSERGDTSGNFTLVRESRTITATTVSFTSKEAAPGEGLGIDVKVAPAVSGPVTVDIERFDPVFGWQFYRESHAFASGGLAVVPFTPPAVGRWRANATYHGSLTASPSAVGFTYLTVS